MTTFAMTAIIKVTFNGRNGAGSISVPGVKVGDYILNIQDTADSGNGGNAQGAFVIYVGTDDTINQASGSDQSGTEYTAFLVRM